MSLSTLHTVLSGDALNLVLERIVPADPLQQYVPSHQFKITLQDASTRIGHLHLRVGDPAQNENLRYAGHIGYAVDAAHRGHGYAGDACRLVAPYARRLGMVTVLITCNPDNTASRRTIEKLGARFLARAPLPRHLEMYLAGDREKLIYEWDLSAQ